MKNLFAALALILFSIPTLSAQEIAGDWHGVLEVMGQKLRLVFHIEAVNDGLTATLDSPDQGAFGISIDTISFDQATKALAIQDGNLAMTFTGTLDLEGSTIEGTFKQRGMEFPLKLQQEAIEKPTFNRPQEPKEPYPYSAEDVTFENTKAGITLAGTLTLPKAKGPHPVVVMISGSGPQDRNEELLGHKPFLVIADHLTKAGIGVLRFDDRGFGESTGDFAAANSSDFATDVAAAVAFLKQHKDIQTDKIGLVGHSEGGLIAPMVAADNPDIAFIVMLAGPGVSGDKILILQQEIIGRAEGASEEDLKDSKRLLKKIVKHMKRNDDINKAGVAVRDLLEETYDELSNAEKEEVGSKEVFLATQSALVSPWMHYFFRYDPRPTLRRVKCPVLALNGEKDLQVDPDQNLPQIEKALKKAKNKDVTIMELPKLNHLFQTSETGKVSEYGKLEETFAPIALETVSKWILERVN